MSSKPTDWQDSTKLTYGKGQARGGERILEIPAAPRFWAGGVTYRQCWLEVIPDDPFADLKFDPDEVLATLEDDEPSIFAEPVQAGLFEEGV